MNNSPFKKLGKIWAKLLKIELSIYIMIFAKGVHIDNIHHHITLIKLSDNINHGFNNSIDEDIYICTQYMYLLFNRCKTTDFQSV